MTRVFLVRHGQTVWHAENRYCGTSDVALSPRGLEQAGLLADWARTARLDAIWVSPLARARATAEAAGRASGLTPRVDARLRELDFGRGEGLTAAEMAARFPDAWDAFRADPVRSHLPDGEDPAALVRRGTAALDELAFAHPDGRALVVAHTTFIRLVLCHGLGIPLSNYRRTFPGLDNVALTELDWGADGAFALRRLNAPLDRFSHAAGPAASGHLA
jgi:broad specificity phosphatase PhoE